MIRTKIAMTLLFVVFFLKPFELQAQDEQGIQFLPASNWKKILERSNKEHKPIFVDAYATWCVPCKKMDNEVYNQSSIGNAINSKFIAVKIQMDQNKNDDHSIKALYGDALSFTKKYNINTLPTFLFFDENGLLLHQDIGFKGPEEFLTMVAEATDPQKGYGNQVKIYRSGIKDYPAILKLYFNSKKLKNSSFADSLAMDLKINYFEKLPSSKVFNTQENLLFLGGNIRLLSSNDKVFEFCVLKLKDSTRSLGLLTTANAEFFVNDVIANEEVINKLPLKYSENENPNWTQYEQSIRKKYPFTNAKKIIIYPKQDYYAKHQNWVEFAKAINELNQIVPVTNVGLDAFWRLNGTAWSVFEKTDDPFALGEALKWVDMALMLKPKPEDNLQFLDTRANVLYRLGGRSEAIVQEEKAIQVALDLSQTRQAEIYMTTLIKMKAGIPTWPTLGPNKQ